MKIGFNLLLWTTHVTDEHLPLLEKLKAAGYDGVEIPIFEGDPDHFAKIGKALKNLGLGCTSVTVIPDEGHNPISSDAHHRASAVQHLKWAIDCSQALGSEVLCGPIHQPLGVFSGQGPTEQERNWAADVHVQAAEFAKQANLTIAIEYLNRFECYFLTTMADAVRHVKRVNHPNFATMYDTFHANIEEKDPIGCIAPAGQAIRHVHISENDRGTPGRGHVPWAATFKALADINYDGWMTIEAFGRALPGLAAATRVWRDLSGSPEEVYLEGLELIKSNLKAVTGASA